MTKTSPHPLDHLVLPTGSLDVARTRLTALGFVVAPVGVHPFGTENACVFFADGTYLEPLAIGNEQVADRAIGEGNVFV
ncbi:MAG: VOC family protein, partial [Mesorhizobium sp.]|nr:VOC family protein [Mesorhizobium sp.]